MQTGRLIAPGRKYPSFHRDSVVGLEQPDFLARAKAVWGDRPEGVALSALVFEAR